VAPAAVCLVEVQAAPQADAARAAYPPPRRCAGRSTAYFAVSSSERSALQRRGTGPMAFVEYARL
jgi:hypothetical protein